MNVMQMLSLDGKVAVVTGGAGLYGQQIVSALAEAGAEVIVASRNLAALERLAQEHRTAGHAVAAMQYDQSSEQSIRALCDQIVARHGQVDVLVNNAVARTTTSAWNSSESQFDASMHINATGLFLITRAFAEPMRSRKLGSVINIGSMMGMVGIENANYGGTDMQWDAAPDYFFHKGGMVNFTRYAASVLGRDNIRVNCVSPGGLRSPNHPEAFVHNYCARTQLGRMANDTDLKGIVVLLASDASAYITGANIPVDGGYTAK